MSTIIFTFPHGLMINASHLKEKKGLQTNEFKEICKAFLALHVVQNHGSRLCKRIFPLSNLALAQPILGFTLISVLAMLTLLELSAMCHLGPLVILHIVAKGLG